MTHRTAAVMTLVLTGLLALLPTAARAVELISMPSGGSQLTVPVQGSVDEVLPVTPAAGVELADVEARVVRLTHDGASLPGEALAAVEVSLEPDLSGLRIQVPPDTLTEQGTTTISLLLTGVDDAGDTQRQALDLQIILRPAVLSVQDALQVRSTRGLIGCWLGCSVELPPLRIRAGDGTRLQQLLAIPVGDRSYGIVAPALSGTQPIQLDPPLIAGGVLKLDYELDGAPVLGTQVDVLELTSPQLAAPVRIAFTVTTRRSPGLIVIIVMAGLALGWLVRNGLTAISSATARRRAVLDVIEWMEGLREELADEEFRVFIDGEIGALRRSRPADVTQTLTDARSRVTARVKELQSELDALRTAIDPEAEMLDRGWVLEGGTERALAVARARLQDVREQLGRGDRRLATTRSDDLGFAVRWLRKEAVATLAMLRAGGEATHAAVTGTTLVPLHRVLQRARRLTADATLGEGADTTKALEHLHLALADARLIKQGWLEALEDLDQPRTPAENSTAYDAALARLRSALGEQHDAATMLTLTAAAATSLVDAHGRSRGPSVAAGEPPVDAAAVVPPRVDPARPPTAGTRAWIATQRIALRLVGGWAELARWALLATLLSLLAFQWFEPSWIGTVADMMALLTWAFALDVSVEAVRQVSTAPPTLRIGAAAEVAPAPSEPAPAPAQPEPTSEREEAGPSPDAEAPTPEDTAAAPVTRPAPQEIDLEGDAEADDKPSPPGQGDEPLVPLTRQP